MLKSTISRGILALGFAATIAAAGATAAQAGKIRGTYSFSFSETCQINVKLNKNNGALVGLSTPRPIARFAEAIGTVQLTSTNGGVSGLFAITKQREVGGAAFRVNGVGEAVNTTSNTVSNLPYSAGADSVTIDGETFFAIFQRNDPNGIARNVRMIRQDGKCALRIELYRP